MPESDISVPVRPRDVDSPRTERLREQVRSLKIDEPVRSGGGGRTWLLVLVCLGLLGTNAWTGWRLHEVGGLFGATKPEPDASPAPGTTAVPGSAAPRAPVASTGEIALESKGYVIPRRKVLVSPKVSGTVVKLTFQEGSRVAKDDVLAELESTEFRADRDQAAATLALAQARLLEQEHGNRPEEVAKTAAELAEAEARLLSLKGTWERRLSLLRQGAGTTSELEQAESDYQAMLKRAAALRATYKLMEAGARAERIAAAKAEVAQARAVLDKAEWRLGNCTIRAPLTGTILTKNAEEGNIVNPIAFNGSFSLCEMADLSDMEVDLAIEERDVARVYKGQRCRIRAEAFPDRIYDGSVSRLMPIADRAKGAVPVRVRIEIPDVEAGVYLKPEMGALVTFLAAPGGSAAPVGAADPSEPGR